MFEDEEFKYRFVVWYAFAGIGVLTGIESGYDFAGIGGAVLGAVVGGLAGFAIGLLVLKMVFDFIGLTRELWIPVFIVVTIAVLTYLFWGVK